LDDFDYSVFTKGFCCWKVVVVHLGVLYFYGSFIAFKVGVCETLKIGSVLLASMVPR